jgi:hypothetical protein
MPRSGDQFPQDRGGSDIRWPTRNLLDYTQPLNDTAVEAGRRITNQIAAASDQGGQQASNQTITALLQQLGIGVVIGDSATNQLGNYLAQLLTPNSALNASNLWGLLPPGTLGPVPATSITAAQINPLWNPNFEGAVSMGAADGWTWDNVTYYPPPGPAPFYPVGSAKVGADGRTHVLKSNPFAVAANQTVAFSVPVLGTNLVATGNPIQISVVQYLDDTIVGTQDIQAVPAPIGPTTGWVAPPAGSHGTLLAGSYIVPIDHTVNKIRLLLTLTSTATAGVARYGAVGVTITGGVIATLQDGLNSLNLDSAAATQAAANFQTALLDAITEHADDWGAMYAAISAAYTTYATTTADLAANEVATIGQILNAMLGINPATGTIAPAKVDGLTELQSGFEDLQTESQTQQDAWGTMMASWKTTLNNGALDWTTKISQLESAFSTYQQVAQGVASAQVITVTSIINGLLGINPATGSTQQAQVEGLDNYFTELGAALTGNSGTAAGPWAWLGQLIADYYTMTGQAHSTAIDNANVLAIQNNASSLGGLDDTTEANMPLSSVNLANTSGTYQTATTGNMTLVRCQKTSNKGAVAFLAAVNSGPVTSLILNIYKFNKATGGFDFLQVTGNLASQLSGTTPKWIRALLPGGAGQIATSPGDVIGIMPVAGPATSVRIYGQAMSIIPAHPTAVQKNVEAQITTYTTGNPIPAANVQWLGSFISYMALEVTNLPADFHPDYSTPYTTSGSQTLDTWAKFVDLVGVGQGGGGQGETGGTVGRGGSPGQWNGKTLVVGTDIAAGGTISWTVQPNPSSQGTSEAGSGGAYFGDGQDGASTVFTWTKPGVGTQTLACPGGVGGGIHNGSNATTYGQGPGNYTFPASGPSARTYIGGAAALTPASGNPPGGSGPGGQPFQYGFNGARGQAWVVERYT